MTREQAERHAADLELQYEAHGSRPADTRRSVTPCVPIEIATWTRAGIPDYWLRDAIHRPTRCPGIPAFYGRIRTDIRRAHHD